MAQCSWCRNEMHAGNSCTVDALHLMGERFDLPRFGQARGEPRRGSAACWDCGVHRGGFHHPGCDMQACPRCGNQLLSCGCGFDEHAIELTVRDGSGSWSEPPVPFGVDSNGYPVARTTMDGMPVILHYIDIPDSDKTTVEGIACTNTLRTVIDLASGMDDVQLRRMVDDALARELFTLHDAWARLDQPDLREHRGAQVLKAFLRTIG